MRRPNGSRPLSGSEKAWFNAWFWLVVGWPRIRIHLLVRLAMLLDR